MPPHSVVAVAQDPGGSEALVPVLKALIRHGWGPVSILARQQGCAVFSRAGLEVTDGDGLTRTDGIPTLDGALRWLGQQRPELVLTATSFKSGWERAFIRAAHQRQIPCVTVLDSWTNYLDRFLEEGETTLSGEVLPDRLTVMDGFSAGELGRVGFPENRLRIVGQPALDEFARWSGSHAAGVAREQLRAFLGVPKESTLVTFFSQQIRELYGPPGSPRYLGYDEFEVLGLLKAVLADSGRVVTFVVKPHPKESPDKFNDTRTGSAPPIRVVSDLSADALIVASDGVVSMTSIALVKGAIAGRRILSVQPALRGEDSFVLGRMGLLRSVTDASQLPHAVRSLWGNNGDSVAAPSLPFLWTDGGAVRRVLNVIEEVLR